MSKIQAKVATLVFVDLETTGLPSDVGKKNVHITEMSFVAVDRNSFVSDQNLRALNKLSLCIRPRAVVSPAAMDITGLYNDILEPQKEFDDSVPKLLEYFFRRLQEPICLLAHNGIRFDFPVLQAELKRINYALDPHILCADTIHAFRSIFSFERQLKAPVNKGDHDGDEIDVLLSQDIESFAAIDCVSKVNSSKPDEFTLTEGTESIKQNKETEFLDPKQSEKTPTSCKCNARPMDMRRRKNVEHNWSKADASFAKRALFPKQTITKFSLGSLYSHFFREPPSHSHYAEMDCMSLSKVCQKINKDFLDWVDTHCDAFSNIEAMWQ